MIASSRRRRGRSPARGAQKSTARQSQSLGHEEPRRQHPMQPIAVVVGEDGGVDATTESFMPRTARNVDQLKARPLPHTQH
ncbi:hypothetical protein PSPO01_00577 [Paraphaeosphaeria sporulosa]